MYMPPGIKQIDWFGNTQDLWANPQSVATVSPNMTWPTDPNEDQRVQAYRRAYANYSQAHMSQNGPPGGVMGTGYQQGTPSATPGYHVVGEAGPEVVRMNGGEAVYPNQSGRYAAGPVGGRKRKRPVVKPEEAQSQYDAGYTHGQLNSETGVERNPTSIGAAHPQLEPWRGVPSMDHQFSEPGGGMGSPGLLPPSAPPGQQVSPEAYQAYYGPGGPGGWQNPATNSWEARTSMPGAGAPGAAGGQPGMPGQGGIYNHVAFADTQGVQHHYEQISGMYYPVDPATGQPNGAPIPTVQFRQAMAELYGTDPFTGQRTLQGRQQDFNEQQSIINRFGYAGRETPMNYAVNRANANARATLYDPQAQSDYETGRDYLLNHSPHADAFQRGEDIGGLTDPGYASLLNVQRIRRASGLPY